jgi:hypothetical protein
VGHFCPPESGPGTIDLTESGSDQDPKYWLRIQIIFWVNRIRICVRVTQAGSWSTLKKIENQIGIRIKVKIQDGSVGPVATESHHFDEEPDPDPNQNQSENPDPDTHQNQNSGSVEAQNGVTEAPLQPWRLNMKIWRLTLEAGRLTMEACRLTLEPGRSEGQWLQIRIYHFDEKPDPDPQK